MTRFTIAKLEDRIAPTSGVFLGNDLLNDSGNGNGNLSDVGNVTGNLNDNSVGSGNSIDLGDNTIGNVVFSG